MANGEKARTTSTQDTAVLIVDDDREIGEMLKTIISEQTNYNVVWIAESQLVLEAARHLQPSLILLDYIMPSMDGLQLYDNLQMIETMRGVPVIFISGGTTLPFEQLRERGIHVLKKPFEINDLLDLLAQLVSHR
jgi:DNA-binding response OmpR family regulator